MKTILLFMLFSLPAFAIEEEETEAMRALRLSCEKQKVALGCYNYANMLTRDNKSEQSEKIFELGCQLGHTQSCQKEKWDIPERKIAVTESVPIPSHEATPAPASVPEEQVSGEVSPGVTPVL